ncbi:MAG: altronate dehydratase, partial [Deltaproteobacteria bacterium]|nr:altronate dehydratase [Deltaproteobacteria bacterium]
MKQRVLKVHAADNVIVALQDLKRGETVRCQGKDYRLASDIDAKHKFFAHDMQPGEKVIMYGVLVGMVQQPVSAGGLMTPVNVKHAADPFFYRPSRYEWTPPDVSRFTGRTFNGYHRSDGRVGTANYWLFIPTVFCQNRNLDVIHDALHEQLGYSVTGKYRQKVKLLAELYARGAEIGPADLGVKESVAKTDRLFPHVDGIKFLNHAGGCGGTRQDAALLARLLAAYADHPNVGGVTVLSLGCENLQVQDFMNALKERNPRFDKPLHLFEHQQSQSEEELITAAIRRTFEGLIELNKMERRPAPLSRLSVGVKCGGSDGFSGISANPAVGYCSDLLVALE